MHDLIAFLRARLDEDERVARGAQDARLSWITTAYTCMETERHGHRHDPARVLAEVEAKRQILEECTAADEFGDEGQRVMAVRVIELLMVPYAEHEEDRLLLEEVERRLANDNGVRHELDDVIGKSIRRWWNLLERLKGK